MDGSTRPGPGFRRKVRVSLMTNQTRAAEIRGIVTVAVAPEAPSGMAQFAARGCPVDEGEDG